jgi:hypothetical protein
MHVIYDTESLVVHGMYEIRQPESWVWPASIMDTAGRFVMCGMRETTAIRIFTGEVPTDMAGGKYKLVEVGSDELVAA